MGGLLYFFLFFASTTWGIIWYENSEAQREHEIQMIQLEMDYERCFTSVPSNPKTND